MADKTYRIALNGAAVEQTFYGNVIALTVEESTTGAGMFQLHLNTILLDDGTWTYLDDDRLALFTPVTIQIGFTSGATSVLQSVFDGYITTVSLNLESQPGHTHLVIGGMDTSVLMSLEEKIVTWPNMADSDIVQQIVGGYGVQVQAPSTPTVHQDTTTTMAQRGSDIQFVRALAQRNGREFYFETDANGERVAYFRPPQLQGTPQPDLAIQFGAQSNLRSFSAQMTGQRPLNVKTEQMDVPADSPNIAQVGDTELTKLGAKDANALVGGPLSRLVRPRDALAQMLVLGPPTSDATELRTVAQAVRDEASWFITACGEINSDAYQAVLRPRRLVLVKGAGTRYSGTYYVTRVVHQIQGDGSYAQKFEARRNARDLDGSERFSSSGQNASTG